MTADVRRYWTRVVDLGCTICRGPAEVAHAHGGSLLTELGILKAKGKKLARMDWLVLPLCPWHHRLGEFAMDLDVAKWEGMFGTQIEHLDSQAKRLGVDIWAKAGVARNVQLSEVS